MHCVHARPVLEVNATLGKHLLDCLDEFVYECIEGVGRWPGLAKTQIQRIAQVLLIVRACIEIHRKQVLRGHTSTGRIELQLADGDSHPVCSDVAKAKDPATVRHANETHVLFRPVLQYLLHGAATSDGQIHAASLAVDVSELQARFSDSRVVYDWQKACWIGHNGPIEQGLVVVEQV